MLGAPVHQALTIISIFEWRTADSAERMDCLFGTGNTPDEKNSTSMDFLLPAAAYAS